MLYHHRHSNTRQRETLVSRAEGWYLEGFLRKVDSDELWWTPTTEIFKWWSSHWHEQRWFLEGFCSESVWWLKSLAGLSQRPSWINFLGGSSTDCSKLLVGIYTIWKILGDATKVILSLGFCYCYPCYCLIQEGKSGGSGGGEVVQPKWFVLFPLIRTRNSLRPKFDAFNTKYKRCRRLLHRKEILTQKRTFQANVLPEAQNGSDFCTKQTTQVQVFKSEYVFF